MAAGLVLLLAEGRAMWAAGGGGGAMSKKRVRGRRLSKYVLGRASVRWPSEWAWPVSLPQESKLVATLVCGMCVSSEWKRLVLDLDLDLQS